MLGRLEAQLAVEGVAESDERAPGLPSGPDFQRDRSSDRRIIDELQTAKTSFQHEMTRRARPSASGLRVATPEDLLVLELIADRQNDARDLAALAALPRIDGSYVEPWSRELGVDDRVAS